MPNRSPASLLRWLFCCAICLSTLELRAQEPKQVIVVESWVAAVDFQKLRSLDLTWDQLGADGRIRTIKIIDVLTGKIDNAQIVQRPEELLKLLQRAGVARVLAEPKMVTVSGQKATLEIGAPHDGLKIEAVPVAKENGRINMYFKVEINEPLPGPRFGNDPPAKKRRQSSFGFETESGLVALNSALLPGMSNLPTPLPTVFVRATLEKPASLVPAASTANAAYREIR